MQDERKWAIIVIVFRGGMTGPPEWLPLHRYFDREPYNSEGTITDVMIKDLTDVIRNPDFDKYEMAFRWAMSRDDFFNLPCLKQINKLHIMVDDWWDFCVPMALAILKKENTRRKRKWQLRKPLKIVLYYQYSFPSIDHFKNQPGGEFMEVMGYWWSHPLYNKHNHTRNNKDVFIHLLDGGLSEDQCEEFKLLLQNQDYHYRMFQTFKSSKDACYNEESIKTFGSPEELFHHMTNDICRNSLHKNFKKG